jgi:hypothetical protein
MGLSTAKEVRVMFDMVTEQFEAQDQMSKLVGHYDMTGANAQNSNNVEWRQVEQQAPVQSGWEFADSAFGDVLELSYPSVLGTPRNDLFKLRADDFRNRQFMDRRAAAAAQRLSADQNARIAGLVSNTGSLFYRATTAGYDFIKTADTILRERQAYVGMGQSFFVNDRDAQRVSADLAGRQTLTKIAEDAYTKGLMFKNTAGFDIYESSYLGSLAGGALAGVTVTSTVSQAPIANFVSAGITLPVDYRISDNIALTGTITGLVVGDRISFSGVNAVGLQDKTNTGTLMTFTVVEKSGASIKVYPRPIAVNDPALTPSQAAYANINTQIAAGATVTKLNSDAIARNNVFWANDSVEIVDGDIPFELLGQLDGMEVMSSTLSSGTKLYIAYQGRIDDLTLRCRLFTWNDVVNIDPSRNGVAILA